MAPAVRVPWRSRRLLKRHGLDRSEVHGTGRGRRVTRDDVLAAVAAKRAAASTRPPPAVVSSDPPAAADWHDGGGVGWFPPAEPDGEQGEASDPGKPMLVFTSVASTNDELGVGGSAVASGPAAPTGDVALPPVVSAHGFCAVEVDLQRVEKIRLARSAVDDDLGYVPFVARAVIDALTDFPRLNAAVTEDHLVVRRSVHLGIALGHDDAQGRVVPVIRDADEKLVRGIARELAELERHARAGEVRPSDLDGGTFTITKPGVGDTLVAAPIIERPQVAVLATDGGRRRPVLVQTPDGSEGIAVHTVGTIGLCFDLHAVDATYASAFLDRVRTLLETRDWSTEL